MDRHGRTIFKNPGAGGKYYVMNGTKKVYLINKNFDTSNHPEYYTVAQLQEFAKKLGLSGYSKLKKLELFDLLKSKKPSGPSNANILAHILKQNWTTLKVGNVTRNLGVSKNRVRKVFKNLKQKHDTYTYNPDKNRYKTFANIIKRYHDY